MSFPLRFRSAYRLNRLNDNAASNGFWNHTDGAAGAFGGAERAALAVIVIEPEAIAGTELDHRIVRADAVTVIALEAIAARKATPRLVERIGLVEPPLHFLECALPADAFQH